MGKRRAGPTEPTEPLEEAAPEPIQSLFGRNLKRARQKAGLSTYDVFERTGVPRQRLAQIEAGTANVTLETMDKLAKVVDHDLHHLLTEQPDDIRT